MGNQTTSGMSAKERSYFSVEYLNGNHDLDFTQLEKFTNKNYLESINTLTREAKSNLLPANSQSETQQQYETLDRSSSRHNPDSSNLLKTSCRSTQNLLGLVRNGGVLVQRSKSYVKPENRVLPTEWPSKPLKQTHLLKTEGMKRTWRGNGNNKANFFKAAGTFDFDASEVNINPNLIKNLLLSQSNCDVVNVGRSQSYSASGAASHNRPISVVTTTDSYCSSLETEQQEQQKRQEISRSVLNLSSEQPEAIRVFDMKKLPKDNKIKKLEKRNSVQMDSKADKITTEKTIGKKLSSWSMLVKSKPARKNPNTVQDTAPVVPEAITTKEALSKSTKYTSKPSQEAGKKIGKSRSFLHTIKSYHKPSDQVKTSSSRVCPSSSLQSTPEKSVNPLQSRTVRQTSRSNKDLVEQLDNRDNIQIISRFPINSKVYRHYIAGNGNKCDKLTNSVEISSIIKRKSFSKKRSSIRNQKKRIVPIVSMANSKEQQRTNKFNTFVVRKHDRHFVSQERAIDVVCEPVYDSIEDYISKPHTVNGQRKSDSVDHATLQKFYFGNDDSISSEETSTMALNPKKNLCPAPLSTARLTKLTRPHSLNTDLTKANQLINSCKKILNENSDLLDYDYLIDSIASNISNADTPQQHNSKFDNRKQSTNSPFEVSVLKESTQFEPSSLSTSPNTTSSSSGSSSSASSTRLELSKQAYADRKIRIHHQEQTKQTIENISEFYLRSPEVTTMQKTTEQKSQPKSVVRIISKKQRPDNSNFILKPKERDSDLVNVYQTINNEFMAAINPRKDEKDSKQVSLSKNRRKGLEEIFPDISIEQEIFLQKQVSSLKIKDPNWVPASDLADSDLEEDSSAHTNSSFNENIDKSRNCGQKIFSHIFNERQIDQNKLNSNVVNSRRSSTTSYSSRVSFEQQRQEHNFLNEKQFGQLNILY